MINDQKVNTYFQRTIDFLDLLNLIFYIIKHRVTQDVFGRFPHDTPLPSHSPLHITHYT